MLQRQRHFSECVPAPNEEDGPQGIFLEVSADVLLVCC
jgi:hypothetical protein